MKVKLIKMGMDFYGGDERWDMGNYRVRPYYDGAMGGGVSDGYIKLKGGGYIAGDFEFWRKNNTNNKEGDRLHWSFTVYDDKLENGKYFHGFDKYTKQLDPTLENIAKLLSEATGEAVTVRLAED